MSTTTVNSAGYSWISNGPPGPGIAFPGAFARPNGSNAAQGDGTWNNPHTAAVSADLRSSKLPLGKKFYFDTVSQADGLVRRVKSYCVVEDDAGGKNMIVVWVGGS